MSATRPPVPEPVAGEVLAIRRTLWWSTLGPVLFGGGIYVILGGLVLVVAILAQDPRLLPVTLLFWSLGGCCLWGLWHLLTHTPRLVLGRDRLQVLLGKQVFLEVPYTNVAEVALASGRVGFMPVRFIGLRLARPEEFDAAWPRRAKLRQWWRRLGFDLGVRDIHLDEPLERCHEAVLRCYHHFHARQDPGAPVDEPGGVIVGEAPP
jgi:hypothetical protein